MRELLKEEWPDRQWIARLYHWIRPRMVQAPAAFDEMRTFKDADGTKRPQQEV
jgi:hypothetical protein